MGGIFSKLSNEEDTYDRSESEESGLGRVQCYEFPAKLQDPVLAARRYRVVKKLGKGSYGKVFLVWDERRQRLVAMKVQSKKREELGREEEHIKFLQREMACLREQHHENIIEWFHTIETTTDLYVSLEFCAGDTIAHLLGDRSSLGAHKGRLLDDQALHFFVQILSAICYLHTKTYCHRDLKNENIMLDRPFDEKNYRSIVVKVTDFGFARSAYTPYRGTLFRRVQHPFARTFCGTEAYSSPELLRAKLSYNPLVNDLWSLGVILYEMLSGHLPFEHSSRNPNAIPDAQKLGAQFDPQWSKYVSPLAIDLIVGMLQYNPEERFVMRDVLLHPFVYEKFVQYERSRLTSCPTLAARVEASLVAGQNFIAPYRLSADCFNRVLEQHNIYNASLNPTAPLNAREGCVRLRPDVQLLEIMPRVPREETFVNAVHWLLRPPPPPKAADEDAFYRQIGDDRVFRCVKRLGDIFKSSPEFPERQLLLEIMETLLTIQCISSTRGVPAIQDALSLLQAFLYRPTSDFAMPLLQRTTATLCSALMDLQTLHNRLQTVVDSGGYTMMGTHSRSTFDRITEDLAGLKQFDEKLHGLIVELDMWAERSDPGFLERTLGRLLDSGPPIFLGPCGDSIPRTPDGRAIVIGSDGSHTEMYVPVGNQQLRAFVEADIRAKAEKYPLDQRMKWLSSRLVALKNGMPRVERDTRESVRPNFAKHFEDLFRMNLEVVLKLLAEIESSPKQLGAMSAFNTSGRSATATQSPVLQSPASQMWSGASNTRNSNVPQIRRMMPAVGGHEAAAAAVDARNRQLNEMATGSKGGCAAIARFSN